MKNLTTALFSKLSGSSLDTLIGGRMFKGNAYDGTEYPYVVFMVISDVQSDTFKSSLDDVLIQFSIFSDDSSSGEIENIYAALKSLYDNATLTITGATLCMIARQSATLMVEDHTTPDGTAKVWHYAIEYTVIQERT